MPSAHLIRRATILGTGLIGGSFALALRKYTSDIHIAGWDRPEIISEAQSRGAIDRAFSSELAPALGKRRSRLHRASDRRHASIFSQKLHAWLSPHTLITDACSTKVRITEDAAALFPKDSTKLFLGGHPMAGRELSGIAHADADLFRNNTSALIMAGLPIKPTRASPPSSKSWKKSARALSGSAPSNTTTPSAWHLISPN